MVIFLAVLIPIIIVFVIMFVSSYKSFVSDNKTDADANFLARQLCAGGLAGIMIGDRYDFVLSRMVHIKLITQKEAIDFQKSYIDKVIKSEDWIDWFTHETFEVTPVKVKGVDKISFKMNHSTHQLATITIEFTNIEKDYSRIISIISQHLDNLYGNSQTTHSHDEKLLNVWGDKNFGTVYTLCNDKKNIIISSVAFPMWGS